MSFEEDYKFLTENFPKADYCYDEVFNEINKNDVDNLKEIQHNLQNAVIDRETYVCADFITPRNLKLLKEKGFDVYEGDYGIKISWSNPDNNSQQPKLKKYEQALEKIACLDTCNRCDGVGYGYGCEDKDCAIYIANKVLEE